MRLHAVIILAAFLAASSQPSAGAGTAPVEPVLSAAASVPAVVSAPVPPRKLSRRAEAARWHRYLDPPQAYRFEKSVRPAKSWSFDDFDVEELVQANGPGTFQRVLKVFPKNFEGRLPAVVVPFYFPEAMLGFEPETGEVLPNYAGIKMMSDLARRGFACISAEAYHLTYTECGLDRGNFKRWQIAGDALMADWPSWTGMGKLVADTRLLIDLLEEDSRIDSSRIGITGHSLGGKMAFYTGCLDKRIKVIMCSDFGFRGEQSNWEKVWYWGDRLEELKAAGMDHTGLLSLAGGKPFFLIAGKYDDDSSYEAMKLSRGYRRHPERLAILNHASGHRPPPSALSAGYSFLERYLK